MIREVSMIAMLDIEQDFLDNRVDFTLIHGPLNGQIVKLPEYTANTLTLNINGQVGKYVACSQTGRDLAGKKVQKLIPHSLFWEPKL
jgi:hypothetical protein